MSKPIAFGLIIFFLLIIVGGLIWLLFFSGEGGAPGIIDRFFPTAGERDRPIPVPGSEGPDLTSKVDDETARRLIQISAGRISGFHPVASGVRYIERITGHVFESSPDGKNQKRISNITIPGIFDSVWAFDGSGAVINYREEGSARMASVKFVGTTTEGVLIPQSIKSIDYAPDRRRLTYIADVNGTLAVIAADPDNTKQSEVTRLPFADFEISWPAPKLISLITRPSGTTDGYLFSYNIDTKLFSKLLGGELGLEGFFAPSGKKVLASVFDQASRRPNLIVYDGATKNKEDLQTNTLARKCAWLAKDENIIYCAIPASIQPAIYPDGWYKGEVEFNDALWSIDITTLQKENLVNLPDIDIDKISVSSDGAYIYFWDKKEGALWSYRLTK